MERTAIVTGGTGGLGSAVTGTLIGDGWRVVVPWYDERELTRVEEHERLDLVQADLTDPASAAEVVSRAGESLRALVNLVGGFAQGERVHETPVDDFERLLRLNLRPTYLMSAAALLRQNPLPSSDQVKAALDRNLCRCGSQNRIVRAVLRAASEMAG